MSRTPKRLMPVPGKISGLCKQNQCTYCFTLSCSHDCHGPAPSARNYSLGASQRKVGNARLHGRTA